MRHGHQAGHDKAGCGPRDAHALAADAEIAATSVLTRRPGRRTYFDPPSTLSSAMYTDHSPFACACGAKSQNTPGTVGSATVVV